MEHTKVYSSDKKQYDHDYIRGQQIIALLHDLKKLYEDGVVSISEFESGKSKLLQSL